MRNTDGKRLFGIAAVTAGLLFLGTVGAWYGDPWYRPYGSGAVTYERQNMMRKHAYAMSQLADMLQGRHLLNRDEAVRLARDLEAGFGDSLIEHFPPGTVVAGSRTAPRTWRYFGAFRNNAEAAKQAAARLAEALEKEPSVEEVQQLPVWGPPWRMGYGARGHRPGGLVSMEVIQEFDRLNATCNSCHMQFRGWRR
ncbi:MAG: cytochrome c [Sedimenticolaceae bacterium]